MNEKEDAAGDEQEMRGGGFAMRLVTLAKKQGDGGNLKLKRRRPPLSQSSAVSMPPSMHHPAGACSLQGRLPLGFSGFPLLTTE
jgi:hypothetical protein